MVRSRHAPGPEHRHGAVAHLADDRGDRNPVGIAGRVDANALQLARVAAQVVVARVSVVALLAQIADAVAAARGTRTVRGAVQTALALAAGAVTAAGQTGRAAGGTGRGGVGRRVPRSPVPHPAVRAHARSRDARRARATRGVTALLIVRIRAVGWTTTERQRDGDGEAPAAERASLATLASRTYDRTHGTEPPGCPCSVRAAAMLHARHDSTTPPGGGG